MTMARQGKKLDFSDFDLRKFDLLRKYDDDFSPEDGISWKDHILLYTLTGLIFIFIVWASFFSIDEVARGDGKIIPTSEVQAVQNLEGGIIDDILVREGDVVQEGQVILHLRNVQAKSDLETNNEKYYGIMAGIIRLQAEAKGGVPVFSEEVRANAPESVAAESAAFEANKKQLSSQNGILKSQIEQKKQEITGLKKKISDLSGIVSMAQDEHDMISPMVERGAVSKRELLQADRDLAQNRAELSEIKLSLPRAQAEEREAQERLKGLTSSFRADAQRQLSEKTMELNALKGSLAVLEDRSQRTDIKSPVHGTVKDIKVKTVGGVVRPGETIMEIVPLEEQLLVESRIRPKDIAFIYPGQKAVVRISAYDFSVYGAAEGRVVEISADSLTDERGESFYRVKVRTDQSKISKGAENFPIIPGMQATVDIVTGKGTIMNYILRPFIRTTSMAMAER